MGPRAFWVKIMFVDLRTQNYQSLTFYWDKSFFSGLSTKGLEKVMTV